MFEDITFFDTLVKTWSGKRMSKKERIAGRKSRSGSGGGTQTLTRRTDAFHVDYMTAAKFIFLNHTAISHRNWN